MANVLTKTQKIAVLLSEIDINTVQDISAFLSDDEMHQISNAIEDVHFLSGDLIKATLEEFYTQLSKRGSQSYVEIFSGSMV